MRRIRLHFSIVPASIVCCALLAGWTAGRLSAADEDSAVDRLLERIVEQEQLFIEDLRGHTALLETYIQETPSAGKEDETLRDHYLLGRLDLSKGLNYTAL